MKKIMMALAISAAFFTGANAQTKQKVAREVEKCHISADGKYVTCCKTTLNPAWDVAAKPPAKKPVAVAHKKVVRKTVTHAPQPVRKTYYVKDYQVCKDEGGYYTCCLYENTTTRTTSVAGW
jgi:hypothetical protein